MAVSSASRRFQSYNFIDNDEVDVGTEVSDRDRGMKA